MFMPLRDNLGQNIWNKLDICYFLHFLIKESPLPPSTMLLYAFHSFPRLALGVFMQKNNIVGGGRGIFFYFHVVPIYFVRDCRIIRPINPALTA